MPQVSASPTRDGTMAKFGRVASWRPPKPSRCRLWFDVLLEACARLVAHTAAVTDLIEPRNTESVMVATGKVISVSLILLVGSPRDRISG